MLNRIAFDDAVGSGGLLARLKLVGELAKIKVGLKDVGDGPLASVKRLKLASRANQIRVDLGAHAARAEGGSHDEQRTLAEGHRASGRARPHRPPRHEGRQRYGLPEGASDPRAPVVT